MSQYSHKTLQPRGLYQPLDVHSNCGVGAVVSLDGSPSQGLIDDALTILANLDHRGARGAEENTGDGAGILLQVSDDFFRREFEGLAGIERYAIGQVFLDRDDERRAWQQQEIENRIAEEGFRLIGWRDVPTDNTGLGQTAIESEPVICQLAITRDAIDDTEFDGAVYLLRRLLENDADQVRMDGGEYFVCSLHRRLIVYKGLLTCGQLRSYYPDLSDPDMKSGLAMVHARFSTNTLGAWWLAQPFQHCVHNGEFNTARGNRNWLKARTVDLASERFGAGIDKIKPVVSEHVGNSDSSSFDRLLGLLVNAGRSLPHALRMMIPEAWQKDHDVEPARAAFYDYHSTLMEAWDGPALVVASDGERVAAILDRNGLRPCRWTETSKGRVIIASEAGALGLPPEAVVHKDRLAPGGLLYVDPARGKVVPQEEVFAELEKPHYAEWLAKNRPSLRDRVASSRHETIDGGDRQEREALQRCFGYTEEGLRYLLAPMAEEGIDPVGAMGSDTPPAALSARTRSLFDFFTQFFAQVSNPPIDHLRESLVTSLSVHLGPQRNLLEETAEHCSRLLVDSPVLTPHEFDVVKSMDEAPLTSKTLDITIDPDTSLEAGMQSLRKAAVAAIDAGAGILVLSDRDATSERKPLPSLLATSGLHHHLIREGMRHRVSIVVDSGEPHVVHHLCTLLGYGADAVHPWLAFRTVVADMRERADAARSIANYKKGLESGLLKVMAKMGISTVESYKGAQIFEAIGLDEDFIEEYFANTPCSVTGIGIDVFDRETTLRHHDAFRRRIPGDAALPEGGDYYWRRDGELHQWNPLTIAKLQQAVRNGDYDSYREYAAFINEQSGRLQTISGLMDFSIDPAKSIPVDDVEPVEELVKHFSTGSMSFGSLSQEAHETLAIAMNRLGGKSGTGEGGEQRERFGTERECTMKQVASGRFGVTLDYLNRAEQIEIKMAQGAKPGEGGELPGGKVDEGIAKVRFTVPGVGLISPPPHHDIYSIEDLAQLIHDLKCAAPRAEIHVKLVARAGIGTIAAGVAKAKADAILVSGDSGGTGAAKKTSIKHAGAPWELGLAESQQVLVANRLRSRVTLRADGGFKTGREVAVAALLGAEEFGFGTAPLIALGCIMLRKCHCNTCSVGIATQNPDLRKRFAGEPEHVMNYMRFVATELREIMAKLGFRRLRDMVGQVGKLKQRDLPHPKAVKLDISKLLVEPEEGLETIRSRDQDHKLGDQADQRLWEDIGADLEKGERLIVEREITNVNRSYGTLLSADVLSSGIELEDDQLHVNLLGPAGQSLGAFLARGITLDLEGEANDYVGKGLSGGRVIVRPYRGATYAAAENILIGNVSLYGATAGELYVNGQAGERFAVRNSGATAVVEGVG
ncbi:MAG: glutamate synthase large subunit, partial [Gammaproteobacteria bacterium]|nr:glutamate synthase large subunit [Gammaproteobacteria bacterium]